MKIKHLSDKINSNLYNAKAKKQTNMEHKDGSREIIKIEA